jgi:signal transduction histidine kinase
MLRRVRFGPTFAEVESVKRVFEGVDEEAATEIRLRKDAVIQDYQASAEYKREILEMLKPHLKQMLAQIHDYRQFVSTVVQNMNVILERRDPGATPIEEKLAKASHEEVAIYWAARLLEERLQAALFLLEPERLDDHRHDVTFRFHGCVLKYLRIYLTSFEQRGVTVDVVGESFASVVGNPALAGVIPHTLIDNALKYAPRGSNVKIQFSETFATIRLVVGSYGPRILSNEMSRIFDLFFRGQEASKVEHDGTGFGLYLAQFVASHFGTKIRVTQYTERRKSDRFWTEFAVEMPKAPET